MMDVRRILEDYSLLENWCEKAVEDVEGKSCRVTELCLDDDGVTISYDVYYKGCGSEWRGAKVPLGVLNGAFSFDNREIFVTAVASHIVADREERARIRKRELENSRKARAAERREAEEAHDRAEYERLKAKYEGERCPD